MPRGGKEAAEHNNCCTYFYNCTITITITITISIQSLAEQWDQEAVDRLEVVRAEMAAKYSQEIAITINDIYDCIFTITFSVTVTMISNLEEARDYFSIYSCKKNYNYIC